MASGLPTTPWCTCPSQQDLVRFAPPNGVPAGYMCAVAPLAGIFAPHTLAHILDRWRTTEPGRAGWWIGLDVGIEAGTALAVLQMECFDFLVFHGDGSLGARLASMADAYDKAVFFGQPPQTTHIALPGRDRTRAR